MDRIIWIVEENRNNILDVQRKIHAHGGMKAMCILSVEFLKKIISERIDVDDNSISNPSLILIGNCEKDGDGEILGILKTHPKLASVPVFFMVDELDEEQEEELYLKGAMAAVEKPLKRSSLLKIDNASWQYELSKNYERVLQKKISELESARAIKELNVQLESRNEFLYKVFGKYFSDELIDIILSKEDGEFIGGEKTDIAVLFSDLRGFTSISEKMEPEAITDLLNCYFGAMSEIIMRYGGTIIEFLGDGILAIFGAPAKNVNYCGNAIAAAVNMQNAMKKVNNYCEEKGYEQLAMGVGVHCGQGFVGNVGTEQMMRYNVIGSVVNVCSRIEGYSLGGQVIVSKELADRVSDVIISEHKSVQGKGMSDSIKICVVSGIGGRYKSYLDEKEQELVYKITEDIEFEVCKIEGKRLEENGRKHKVLEFSKGRLKLGITDNERYEAYTDVKLRFAGSKILEGFTEVYAKVVGVEKNAIIISLTRVNEGYRQFVQAIESGKVEYETEWRADMKNRQNVKILPMCEDIEVMKSKLDGNDTKFILAYMETEEDVKLHFFSSDKAIRALEVLDFIAETYGTVKGDGDYASTSISKLFFDVMMSDCEATSIQECLERKIDDYYEKCNWIFAAQYIKSEIDNIMTSQKYKKKAIPWAAVKATDITGQGEKFKLKSLENESYLEFVASPDLYIMIGCRGEIYNITEEKFLATYRVTDEPFDIFSQMPDYIPEVQLSVNDEYVSLDDKAYLCYPKGNKTIYAKQIDCRTKVFSEHNKGEYFVGRAGDYLAVRADDVSDIYIIQREIFEQTYEKVEV